MKTQERSTVIHWTPIQDRIVKILADGQPHKREELLECLNDELATIANLALHIVYIRRKLLTKGEDIVCRRIKGQGRTQFYQHVRLLHTRGST